MISVLSRAAQHTLVRAGILHGRNATPFVIAAGPRSGSTMLQTLLLSHPNIICMHELLNERSGKSRFYRHYFGIRGKLLDLRARDITEFISQVLLMRQPRDVSAIGFKALFTFPRRDREVAWQHLGSIPNLHVILLFRNPIDSVVSFALARQTGAWTGKATKEARILDPAYVLRRLELEDRLRSEAVSYLEDCAQLTTSYEALVKSAESELGKIQDFLGVDRSNLTSGLSKQNPSDWTRIVANSEDVIAALQKTKWAKYLHVESESE